jgi:hypothetical protein
VHNERSYWTEEGVVMYISQQLKIGGDKLLRFWNTIFLLDKGRLIDVYGLLAIDNSGSKATSTLCSKKLCDNSGR